MQTLLRLEKFKGARAFAGLGFHSQVVHNLGKRHENNRVLAISIGVGHGDDIECIFVAIAMDQPSWALGNHGQHNYPDDGQDTLDKRWQAPGPGALDLRRAVGYSSSK